MIFHSWPRSASAQATQRSLADKKAMSRATSSPTHGLGTVMKIAAQNPALHTSPDQGAASEIDTIKDLQKLVQLCHAAPSFP